MKHSPYSTYHGRKTFGQRLLTALVVLLTAALLLALVALFVLPNYLVYTADGPRLELPIFPNKPAVTPSTPPTAAVLPDAPPAAVDDPAVVVEPTASPAPSALPTPAADLSSFPRREMSMGLVLVTPDTLPESSKNGVLVDLTGTDLATLDDALTGQLAALPYAAAWLDGADVDTCLRTAALGFDELVLASVLPQGDGADIAAHYRDVHDALTQAGWQGRLGLVLDQTLFGSQYDADLIPAIAQSFDRLYFRSTLQTANRDRLTAGGFTATGMTLVTVVNAPANLNYAWAMLPQ